MVANYTEASQIIDEWGAWTGAIGSFRLDVANAAKRDISLTDELSRGEIKQKPFK
jgi:hypothetical protein